MPLPVEKNASALSKQKEQLFISHDEKTFKYDEDLPSLPLPSLEKTLEKYLNTVLPHVTEEEFQKTKSIVEDFKNGIGRQLHHKLVWKSRRERNWLEKWWEEFVYLSWRPPLVPQMNMCGAMSASELELWPSDQSTQIERLALRLHFQLQYWKLIRKEELKPHEGKGAHWSMDQWRRLFNTARIPGIGTDELHCFFKTESEGPCGPRNVIVLCKGHIFSFDAIDSAEEPLQPQELAMQCKFIRNWCSSQPEGPGVGSLTLDERNNWAKNRRRLLSIHPENRVLLDLIEQSLLVVVLDDRSPSTPTQILYECFSGDEKNRWADKSVTNLAFQNGTAGMTNDHTPFDGLVTVSLSYYTFISMLECGGKWKAVQCRELPEPRRLDFHLDDHLLSAIKSSRLTYRVLADNVECTYGYFKHYGKDFVRPLRFHPEAYVQMALQLAYHRMYNKFAPTYVTASTRKFYHGRTETCRSCFPEATQWAAAMLKSEVPETEKMALLSKAINRFQKEMADAMENQGCDRHLLGLYMVALEEGMGIPEIFTDPSFAKSGGSGNYILSTSCSGYTPLSGGAMAMCHDGYGAFYSIENERMTFCITAYKNNPDTNVNDFYSSVETSLLDMQSLITNAKL